MGKGKENRIRVDLMQSLLNVPYWKVGAPKLTDKVRQFFEGHQPTTVNELLAGGVKLFQLGLDLAEVALKDNPTTVIVERHLAAQLGVDSVTIQVAPATGSLEYLVTGDSSVKVVVPKAETEAAPAPKKAKAKKAVAPVTKNENIKQRLKVAKAAEKESMVKALEQETEPESNSASKSKKTKTQAVPTMGDLRARAEVLGKLEEIKSFGRKRKDIDAFLKPFETSTPAVEVEETETVDTATKSAPVSAASSGDKGSGDKAAKGEGFLKTGDAVKTRMQEEFGNIEEFLEQPSSKKNGSPQSNGRGLKELVKEANDLDLDAIIETKEEDPDMLEIDGIIGANS